ncbi:MAG: hypothetical protein GF418_02005 [Chitinivibrionales bacterium]|nr:hypothetical protein [Chitinivibrionales bacterium]MBD3394374.1 hypothetical protein [Chitinivibrionales bacterium]
MSMLTRLSARAAGLWALLWACSLRASPSMPHELEHIKLASTADAVTIEIGFAPHAPADFVVYTITRKGSPVLVAEFVDATWLGDRYTQIARPVTHVQMVRDSVGGRTSVRLLFYLEKNVAYRYRWVDAELHVELEWQEESLPGRSPAVLSEVNVDTRGDTLAAVSCAFESRPANYVINQSPDLTHTILTFYNARAGTTGPPATLPPLVKNVEIQEGNAADQIPLAKLIIHTTLPVVCRDSTARHDIVLLLHAAPPAGGAVVATAAEPDTTVAARTGRRSRFLESDRHKTWTYIGVGSGVLAGGAVLGVILARQGRDAGEDDPDEIPPIEDVVQFPE